MPSYKDVQLINDALGNLGNSFYANRQLSQQKSEHDSDLALRTRALEENVSQRRDAAKMHADSMAESVAARTQPTYKWKSGGVEHQTHSLEDFGQEIQSYPADDEDGTTSITLTGTNDDGVTIHQTIKSPKGTQHNPQAAQKVAEQIKGFADMTGSHSKNVLPQEFPMDKDKAYVNPKTGHLTLPQKNTDPTAVETQRSTRDIPEVPEKSHREGGLFGIGVLGGNKVVDSPAVPAHQLTTTRKVQVGSAAPLGVAPPTATGTNKTAKIVIQNGQRFQLNPDGTTIHLGPAQ